MNHKLQIQRLTATRRSKIRSLRWFSPIWSEVRISNRACQVENFSKVSRRTLRVVNHQHRLRALTGLMLVNMTLQKITTLGSAKPLVSTPLQKWPRILRHSPIRTIGALLIRSVKMRLKYLFIQPSNPYLARLKISQKKSLLGRRLRPVSRIMSNLVQVRCSLLCPWKNQ